mgnify:CR=1 FL=1
MSGPRRFSPFRIIPARAGFTPRENGEQECLTDHPRSRGVYRIRSLAIHTVPGSSPLARGLPQDPCDGQQPERIIPARAGFTCAPGWSRPPVPDHPRSRGVYLLTQIPLIGGVGSSPLARGLLVSFFSGLLTAGIIPARAGFTTERAQSWSLRADHPRSRGVYLFVLIIPRHYLGSSPLARGLRQSYRPRASVNRIIPARAGFTNSSS